LEDHTQFSVRTLYYDEISDPMELVFDVRTAAVFYVGSGQKWLHNV